MYPIVAPSSMNVVILLLGLKSKPYKMSYWKDRKSSFRLWLPYTSQVRTDCSILYSLQHFIIILRFHLFDISLEIWCNLAEIYFKTCRNSEMLKILKNSPNMNKFTTRKIFTLGTKHAKLLRQYLNSLFLKKRSVVRSKVEIVADKQTSRRIEFSLFFRWPSVNLGSSKKNAMEVSVRLYYLYSSQHVFESPLLQFSQ